MTTSGAVAASPCASATAGGTGARTRPASRSAAAVSSGESGARGAGRAGGLGAALCPILRLTLRPLLDSVCHAGRWVCKDLPCPGTCALEGGSHITTFDGKKYTFHGDCYYVLTKVGRSPGSVWAGLVSGLRPHCSPALPQAEQEDAFALLGELGPCGSTDKQTCLKTVVLLADKKKNVGAPPLRVLRTDVPTPQIPEALVISGVPLVFPTGGDLQVRRQRPAERAAGEPAPCDR